MDPALWELFRLKLAMNKCSLVRPCETQPNPDTRFFELFRG